MTASPLRAEPSKRGKTSTAAFGSSRREGHDATGFYRRFVPPIINADTTIEQNDRTDVIYNGDARDMSAVADNSVALVVTSPPYFAGKQYEESLGENGVPASYIEYLDLLRDVFAECQRVLEPGGRIAVNVANLGRRPYRSLSADVTQILQELGLLLRGEIVWWKGRAAGGSCAWGSFQRPANPVLRDMTERVVIASKGRFDRAISPQKRAKMGLPSTTTISRDEFMEATTDLWEIRPESATQVGHPAPFPVELPARLIHLYTYADDVVLDPFMGSGSTAVAAVRTDRRYIGFDMDAGYIDAAEQRIADEVAARAAEREAAEIGHDLVGTGSVGKGSVRKGSVGKGSVVHPFRVAIAADRLSVVPSDPAVHAMNEGKSSKELAKLLLTDCGFTDIRDEVKPRGLGIVLSFVATDAEGRDWAFDLAGGFTTSRSGLRKADVLWKALAKAAIVHESEIDLPLVLLTTDSPAKATPGAQALAALRGEGRPIFDVIELLNKADETRLRSIAAASA